MSCSWTQNISSVLARSSVRVSRIAFRLALTLRPMPAFAAANDLVSLSTR